MKSLLRSFSLGTVYHWRYGLMFGVLIAVIVLTALWFGPQGYTAGDYAAVQKSADLGRAVREGDVVDGLFHLKQRLMLDFFGETGARVLNVTLAALTVAALVSVIYMIVHRHASMLAGVLMVASLPFVSMATSLQPTIMMIFWPIVLLLAALHVLRRERRRARILWWLMFVLAASLAMATPLMWVVVGLMMGIGFMHPHARHSVRTLGWWRVFGVLPVIVLIGLVGFTLWQDGSLGRLLGFSRQFQPIENARVVMHATLGRDVTIIESAVMPILSFGVGALALFGIVKLFAARFALRSYFLLTMLPLAAVMALVAPKVLIVAFIFLIIVAGIGLQALIDEWYGLFPLNPYARVLGLVPLALFVGVVVAGDVMRVFVVNEYSAKVVRQRDQGMPAARQYIDSLKGLTPVTVVVPAEKQSLYRAAFDENTQVVTTLNPDPSRRAVVDADLPAYGVPSKLLINDRLVDGLEFRVY